MKYLFDTNIFIYATAKEPEVLPFFALAFLNNNECFYSRVTRIEILSFPLATKHDEILLNNLLNQFFAIPINKQIEDLTIQLRRKKKMKLGDSIIAASALFTESTLITRNERDFEAIPKLKLLNPFASQIK
ncbi:MAG: type II toxin-antitoxin system VapC family toxin [Chloroherpetonaceae bacterium]|nr:type II toxin-antitoxin system VapC family toxin [Chloroherpetonaceae bacterium]